MRWLFYLGLVTLAACKTVEGDARVLDKCEVVADAVATDGFEVRFERYQTAATSDRAIIIMPPTGGTTFLESRYAALFCKSGFNVYVVEGWTGMSETSLDLAIHSRLFGRAQRAIESIIDVSAPTGFVGLLGTSVGGLHAATAAGHLERISAAFVIAAGAPVVDILAETDQEALESLRVRRMREFGLDGRDAYRNALAAEFEWEPLSFAAAAREKPLGMVVVEGDKTVPTLRQKQLRGAWEPEVAYVVSGFPFGAHPVGIFQAWLSHADDILAFFSRHAAPGPDAQDAGDDGGARRRS